MLWEAWRLLLLPLWCPQRGNILKMMGFYCNVWPLQKQWFRGHEISSSILPLWLETACVQKSPSISHLLRYQHMVVELIAQEGRNHSFCYFQLFRVRFYNIPSITGLPAITALSHDKLNLMMGTLDKTKHKKRATLQMEKKVWWQEHNWESIGTVMIC